MGERTLTSRAIGRMRRARIDLSVFWHKRVLPRKFIYKDQFGVSMFLDPREDLKQIFNDRRFFDDEGVLRFCRGYLKQGMTVVDVGANHGQFCLFAASFVGETGKIHAFEPSPGTYAALLENIRLNPNAAPSIVANCQAVNERAGTVTFHEFPPQYSFFNSMHAHTMQSPIVNSDGKRDEVLPTTVREVPAVTLDDYCNAKDLKNIDLLKIDVEGWEVNVIRGARKVIAEKRCRGVIFEISLDPLAGTPFTAPDVIRAFEELGLKVSQIERDGTLKLVDLVTFEPPFFSNYFATLD